MVRIAAELGMTPSPVPASGSATRRPRIRSKHSCTVARAARDDPVTAYARAVTDGQILDQPPGPPGLRSAISTISPAARHETCASIRRRRSMRSPSSASCGTPRASGPARPSPSPPGRPSSWAACSAGSAPTACDASAPPTARCRARTARARCPPASRLYLLVADGEQGAEIYSAATTRDQARIVFDEAKRMVELLPGAQAPGPGADQQPERRGQRLALHAALLGCQLHGRPERAWRHHRRAARPQDPPRGRRARDRHRRPPPAAAVRDHHRRLRPPQHLLRAPRLCDQAAGRHPAG